MAADLLSSPQNNKILVQMKILRNYFGRCAGATREPQKFKQCRGKPLEDLDALGGGAEPAGPDVGCGDRSLDPTSLKELPSRTLFALTSLRTTSFCKFLVLHSYPLCPRSVSICIQGALETKRVATICFFQALTSFASLFSQSLPFFCLQTRSNY